MLFGPDVAQRFLERSSLSLIVRSHEQVLEGFDWPYGDQQHLVTVFSASNYANRTRNKGAFMVIGARGGAEPLPPLPTWLGGGRTSPTSTWASAAAASSSGSRGTSPPRGRQSGRTTASAPPSPRARAAPRRVRRRRRAEHGRLPLALWEATTLGVVGDDVGAASGGEGRAAAAARARRRRRRVRARSTTRPSSSATRRPRRRSTRRLRRPTTSRVALPRRRCRLGRRRCRDVPGGVPRAAHPRATPPRRAPTPTRCSARSGRRARVRAAAAAWRSAPSPTRCGRRRVRWAAQRRSARRQRAHRLDLHDIAAAGAGEGGSRGSRRW